MTFDGTRRYERDVTEAFEVLCDPDVITDRYRSAGDRDVEIVRCEAAGDGFVIETTRTVAVDLPGFAKKVLNPTNTMTQTDRWDGADERGARSGTFAIAVSGAPVSTEGTMRLEPDGEGSRHHVTGRIEVGVALVGGRIARWAEGAAADRLEAEFDFHAARMTR